jgi:hypothetical protein
MKTGFSYLNLASAIWINSGIYKLETLEKPPNIRFGTKTDL